MLILMVVLFGMQASIESATIVVEVQADNSEL